MKSTEMNNDSEPPSCGPPSCKPPLYLQPIFMIGQDSRGNWVVRDKSGTRGGLFVDRTEALRYIRDHPDARVADLASTFAIGVGTTSKIADRLEKQGWLERRPNPANRRSSLLALTPAGESAVSRAEPAWQAAIQEILGGTVTSDELTALSLVLGALRSDLERRHLGLPTG